MYLGPTAGLYREGGGRQAGGKNQKPWKNGGRIPKTSTPSFMIGRTTDCEGRKAGIRINGMDVTLRRC